MHLLPFMLIVAAMVIVVLAPQKITALLLWRVSPEARPPAGRLVPVALVIAFVFTFLAFHMTLQSWQVNRVWTGDPIQTVVKIATGVVFLAYGCFACLSPIKFARTFSPQLRHEREVFNGHFLTKIETVSRSFGMLLVLASAFLFGTFVR